MSKNLSKKCPKVLKYIEENQVGGLNLSILKRKKNKQVKGKLKVCLYVLIKLSLMMPASLFFSEIFSPNSETGSLRRPLLVGSKEFEKIFYFDACKLAETPFSRQRAST